MTVTVTWPENLQAVYEVENWQVENGLLWLHPDAARTAQGTRCIPLCNVLIWTVTA